MTVKTKLEELSKVAREVEKLSRQLKKKREKRNKLALELIDQGVSFRKVADHAGFKNPYLVQLRRKANVKTKNTRRSKAQQPT